MFPCPSGWGILFEVTMPTQKKIEEVERLADKFSKATVAIAADFSSTSVQNMTDLRKHLKEGEIEFRVVKNTLAERAAEVAGRPEIKELLAGPTGLALGFGDELTPIKMIVEYVRANRLLVKVRSATMMDGRVYNESQLATLITLPPKEVLAAQLLGQMASLLIRLVRSMNQPLQGLSNVMNGQIVAFANVLQARIEQQKNS
tara:strand:- start:608 stop:1213 length:606 start_codon:yes stop_codon:yes gene_type:complete